MKRKETSVINIDPEIWEECLYFEEPVYQSKIFLIIWKLVIQLKFS